MTLTSTRNRLLISAVMVFSAVLFMAQRAHAGDDFSMFEDNKPSVSVSTATLQKLGVKLAKVQFADTAKTLRLPGIVSVDETTNFSINTKFGGWIERLYLDYKGKTVRKGALVAQIYSPDMVAAQEEYLSFLKQSRAEHFDNGADGYGKMFAVDTRSLVQSARQRLKYWDLTEGQIRRLERTGIVQRTVPVYSPASGYVLTKNVTAGMKVEPGMEMLSLAGTDHLWIIADVYQEELKNIKIGSTARVTLTGVPDTEFNLKADFIYPEMSARTRTLKVRFLVNNKKDILKPSMYTEINLNVKSGKALSVPEDAVIDDGKRKVVYVSLGGGKFEPREIITGVKFNGNYQVRAGLKNGDIVARGANFMLDSEAQLKGVKPLKVH